MCSEKPSLKRPRSASRGVPAECFEIEIASSEIDAKMYRTLADWIFGLREHGFEIQTVVSALFLVQICLREFGDMEERHLLSYGMVCANWAAKYFESEAHPTHTDAETISDHACSRAVMNSFELRVLSSLAVVKEWVSSLDRLLQCADLPNSISVSGVCVLMRVLPVANVLEVVKNDIEIASLVDNERVLPHTRAKTALARDFIDRAVADE